ncbi:MAG: bile acid:sodium symporter [Desulfobacterales bacterium]|nr:bile acid:sodium symporter [Desulfobacterales bacterium]
MVKKYWFLIGLATVFAATMADPTGLLADAGLVLKRHHGPDVVIFLVFFFSGILLDPGQIRDGLRDVAGTAMALVLIFGFAPALAALASLAPLQTGVIIGLFLVSVMPTTLSSGVVMTGASGGNPAHALFITILANVLCMFTIPFTLPLLLQLTEISTQVDDFNRMAVMIKIGLYVLVPLCAGLGVKAMAFSRLAEVGPRFQIINQCLILCIVWMGVAQARPVLSGDLGGMVSMAGVVAIFHCVLLGCAYLMVRVFSVPRGRMEAVLFMGSQKTLPLSIILQVTLFGQFALALMVCVLHHLVSLLIDGFLVGRLSYRK